jgi:hypothetical protein
MQIRPWNPKRSRNWRPHRGDPEVFVFLERRMTITKDWQLYMRVINYRMSRQHVSQILGWLRAFANLTGFGDPNKPRRDFIQEENLKAKEDPEYDKIRICGGNVFAAHDRVDYVAPVLLDGSKPPPVKEGKQLPESIHDVESNLEYWFDEVYEFNPREHPWYFIVATNVNNITGAVSPFPNGGLYDWTPDARMYTFLPSASPFPVQYNKLDRKSERALFRKLDMQQPLPSPYYAP